MDDIYFYIGIFIICFFNFCVALYNHNFIATLGWLASLMLCIKVLLLLGVML
jgi:hypothetical protein